MFLDTYITNHELNILNATSAKKNINIRIAKVRA
ncbi:MAG: hypothetical protein PG978_000051 [Wolbachia endosymbiont of Ctenocephalides felis wCfeF]|nr:MAG: hypothetical protein PG978_000051 [Wolbachia endosymbiont of Ctenocephalides felis wCfeF]